MSTVEIVEEWRAIPGYEGYYEASDLGRIRSLSRVVNGGSGMRRLPGQIRKQSIGSHGYSVVSMSKEGERKVYCVNRLVLMAFNNGPWVSRQDACHNDGDRQNNKLSNLRWDTRAGNSADRITHGTQVRGSKTGNARLNEAKVTVIKEALRRGERQVDLARAHDVAIETIHSIKAGKSWRHV